MNIILASISESKKSSVRMALSTLGIIDYNLISVDASSEVSRRPINKDIVFGAVNRVKNAKEYADKNNLVYDYIIGIEGGYIEKVQGFFMETEVVIENNIGDKSYATSVSLPISFELFDYVRRGNSLNKVYEELENVEGQKANGGISMIINGNQEMFDRRYIDFQAVLVALTPLVNIKAKETTENLKVAILQKTKKAQN